MKSPADIPPPITDFTGRYEDGRAREATRMRRAVEFLGIAVAAVGTLISIEIFLIAFFAL